MYVYSFSVVFVT